MTDARFSQLCLNWEFSGGFTVATGLESLTVLCTFLSLSHHSTVWQYTMSLMQASVVALGLHDLDRRALEDMNAP